ncbi:MAG: prepilin-type N-terminal cleavage/methylation domain-containing protein [Firmicutes bacterium]|nr:prepilin-type N-terminal cleavage/methylation domain-containing protein [Bacillota bacterium]
MKKKGFTLIELLAVIVILAIIALIAVPVIINIITSARKKAFENTAYGLISAGEMYYAGELLNGGMTSNIEFTIEEGKLTSAEGLDIKGELPKTGKIKVTREGKVALAISNGSLCITKGYDDSKIETLEEFDGCNLPPEPGTLAYLARTNSFATAVATCATDGTACAVGTNFAIEVAPGNIKNFYVVSEENNTVTLIMDSNIDGYTPWIRKNDYITAGGTEAEWNIVMNDGGNNNKGPITALNYLETQTSGWTNIPTKTYSLTDSRYGTITRTNVRSRMLSETEAREISSNNWAYDNLSSDTGIYGYWTSSADATISNNSWYVMFSGYVSSEISNPENYCGVRPVIEILK